MRLAAVILLAGVCACGDPGPRDRSLKLDVPAEESAPAVSPHAHATPGRPTTSVIGLADDGLAPFYAEGATLIVRFEGTASLMHGVAPHLRAVHKALPRLGLPQADAATLLRRVLRLPKSVKFDPQLPFALVLSDQGLCGIVPTRDRQQAGVRMRQLDAAYCVAGDPKVVAAYRPGTKTDFYLPGDCSIRATPEAFAAIGSSLAKVLGQLGLDVGVLAKHTIPLPADAERIDLALHFKPTGARVDLRLAPHSESPTALFLETIRPRGSSAATWLPRGGTAYAELGVSTIQGEGLVLNLFRGGIPIPDAITAPGLYAVRRGLGVLGDDVAAMLDIDAEGAGRVLLVAALPETKGVVEFIRSKDFGHLLGYAAGDDGHLEWLPSVFMHEGIEVGAVTGHISRRRLARWRTEGLLRASLSVLMRGPVTAYVAVCRDKLCVVVGEKARDGMRLLLDGVRSGNPPGNEHAAEVDPLFRSRVLSVTVDVARLFDGTRGAAPYWHKNGRELREIELRWRIPVTVAATVEGGALRLAAQVPPQMLADAAARILQVLER